MKKVIASAGVVGLVFAGAAAMPAAQADSHNSGAKYTKCWKTDGTFQVVHSGDTIDGVSVPAGSYKVKVRGIDPKLTCGMVPGLMRGWLESGEAPNWMVTKSTSKKLVMEWEVQGGATMALKRTKKAKNPPKVKQKTQKCWKKHGTFEVLSSGDTIDDDPIAKGEYRIKAKKISCGAASNYLHEWLETGESSNGWFAAFSKWGDVMFTPSQSAKPNFQIKQVS
ncbi:MAG: hypothetical protein K0U64_06110 [Actinomycetia bacterium]|nr:hypothetical protein [Actinomycetes bacterium]